MERHYSASALSGATGIHYNTVRNRAKWLGYIVSDGFTVEQCERIAQYSPGRGRTAVLCDDAEELKRALDERKKSHDGLHDR